MTAHQEASARRARTHIFIYHNAYCNYWIVYMFHAQYENSFVIALNHVAFRLHYITLYGEESLAYTHTHPNSRTHTSWTITLDTMRQLVFISFFVLFFFLRVFFALTTKKNKLLNLFWLCSGCTPFFSLDDTIFDHSQRKRSTNFNIVWWWIWKNATMLFKRILCLLRKTWIVFLPFFRCALIQNRGWLIAYSIWCVICLRFLASVSAITYYRSTR